jgi:hypothetical protein
VLDAAQAAEYGGLKTYVRRHGAPFCVACVARRDCSVLVGAHLAVLYTQVRIGTLFDVANAVRTPDIAGNGDPYSSRDHPAVNLSRISDTTYNRMIRLIPREPSRFRTSADQTDP